ncbi:pancreatic secretory granule membrane major glycoprotein GP2-like [Mustelus asterias]
MKTLLLILGYLTAVSKSFDPCVKHRVLNQPWRSTNCVGNLCSDSVQCDQSLVLGWYRFKSPGSSTIPETVVPVRRCSTHATGWLKGSHPSLREGIVKRTVCFHWSGNTCRWHQEIKIKRCYNFFVYELKKSPACSLAYCTEAGPVPTQPPTPQTSPPYDSPHWNVTAASGIGGTQIKLVIKFMGHVGVEVMQNIILELQLSLKNRFPDVDLHLSIADD